MKALAIVIFSACGLLFGANIQEELENDPRENLIIACNGYLSFLRHRSGCQCRSMLIRLFDAPLFEHLDQRQRQVAGLISLLKSNSLEWTNNFKQELEKMKPFHGEASRAFKTGCEAILSMAFPEKSRENIKEKNAPAEVISEKEYGFDDAMCIVCFDELKTMVATPCGHHLYCPKCYMRRSRKSHCAVCREEVSGYLQIDLGSIQAVCMVCEEKPADMFSINCSHAALCQACCETKPPMNCLVCNFPSQRYQKLYR